MFKFLICFFFSHKGLLSYFNCLLLIARSIVNIVTNVVKMRFKYIFKLFVCQFFLYFLEALNYKKVFYSQNPASTLFNL